MITNKSNNKQFQPEKVVAERLNGYVSLLRYEFLVVTCSTTRQFFPDFV